jgi:hypothetical protein
MMHSMKHLGRLSLTMSVCLVTWTRTKLPVWMPLFSPRSIWCDKGGRELAALAPCLVRSRDERLLTRSLDLRRWAED